MAVTEPREGLWLSTHCRHCGGWLREVNAGHADGCRSLWVGACTNCGRNWMVRADIAQVPSR